MIDTKHDCGGQAYPIEIDQLDSQGRAIYRRLGGGMTLREYYVGLNVPDQMVNDILSLDDKHLAKLVGANPEDMTFVLRADKNDPAYQTNVVLRLQWVAQAIAMTRGIIADAMIAEKRRIEAKP